MYRVNEIFESIQGEAAHTGTPAVFVRMQGCTVGCAWCDSKATWDKGGGLEMDADAIVRAVRLFTPKHVIITGGEPAEQDLEPLVERLIDFGRRVQIETSGTVKLPWFLDECWLTVSPKLHARLVPETIARASEIKVPIGRTRDIEIFVNDVLPYVRARTPIWLQPLSLSPAATRLCIDEATARGWKVSAQVHQLLGIR